ncbi:Poly(A) polymerase [Hordeum vulgare]|nr:Poly(A) polymerase [Hordeum vulgare]KAI5020500.1 hypothetical protein ZWY2020_045388 [Hordeum vulgare]
MCCATFGASPKRFTIQQEYTQRHGGACNHPAAPFRLIPPWRPCHDSDIDALAVGPAYINRHHDFFDVLRDMLAEIDMVMELKVVPDVYVPITKMRFCSVQVDYLCVNVCLPVVPSDLDLHRLDMATFHGFNGFRVADKATMAKFDADVVRRLRQGQHERVGKLLPPN